MTSGIFNGFTTRKGCVTILFHAVENTVATWEGWLWYNWITLIDGKVRCNTDEYTTAFLYSDWLYFLWHGKNVDLWKFINLNCWGRYILWDPGATSRNDKIFLGESLLQELKNLWELILTKPVPEVVEFRPADWAEKYFSAQSAMRSSRVALLPSYAKKFSSSIDQVARPVQREDCWREFQKKNIQRSRGDRKPWHGG